MWMNMQREVDLFHLKNDLILQWNQSRKSPLIEPQTELPQPSQIANFTVIQCASITIDGLYNILGGIKEAPQKDVLYG